METGDVNKQDVLTLIVNPKKMKGLGGLRIASLSCRFRRIPSCNFLHYLWSQIVFFFLVFYRLWIWIEDKRTKCLLFWSFHVFSILVGGPTLNHGLRSLALGERSFLGRSVSWHCLMCRFDLNDRCTLLILTFWAQDVLYIYTLEDGIWQ